MVRIGSAAAPHWLRTASRMSTSCSPAYAPTWRSGWSKSPPTVSGYYQYAMPGLPLNTPGLCRLPGEPKSSRNASEPRDSPATADVYVQPYQPIHGSGHYDILRHLRRWYDRIPGPVRGRGGRPVASGRQRARQRDRDFPRSGQLRFRRTRPNDRSRRLPGHPHRPGGTPLEQSDRPGRRAPLRLRPLPVRRPTAKFTPDSINR